MSDSITPDTLQKNSKVKERINSILETNGSFDTCISCKQLVPSRLYEINVPNLSFVSRIKFIRSKLSNFPAHVSEVNVPNMFSVIFFMFKKKLPKLMRTKVSRYIIRQTFRVP